ncbi:MAG: helix-turn-helix domain-containing protein [Nostoc sp.]|uniref:helix-turn-helix domain-containing protein n=1 Tax=Nostoc sp. TaxID=1180 RepID=UPI002FF44C5F
MGARLRVFLTRDQDKTLLNLRTADAPQKVKDRAEMIRLNAHGWYVEKIAAHFNWTPQTVREVLHKWEKLGLEGLWEVHNVLNLTLRTLVRDFQEINYSKKRTTETRQRGLGGFPHERLPRRERREKK